MNFLSGQDDFFQTGNQPISVRHLSQPYNNKPYCPRLNRLSSAWDEIKISLKVVPNLVFKTNLVFFVRA